MSPLWWQVSSYFIFWLLSQSQFW